VSKQEERVNNLSLIRDVSVVRLHGLPNSVVVPLTYQLNLMGDDKLAYFTFQLM